MKIHPTPKTQNIRQRRIHEGARKKKLYRLPHIFSRVLVLPIDSETNVSVQENPDCLRFWVKTDEINDDVRAHIIHIYPDVTKIVIGGDLFENSMDDLELELHMWRFRLPHTTTPELATAVYREGKLTVTVPKK